MVQTNSHRFNTHVKRLSLSASVVIIIITRLLALVESSHNNSIIYCCTILPTVHSKLMSHYQLSNFVIHGLEHWKLICIPNSWLFEYVFRVMLCKEEKDLNLTRRKTMPLKALSTWTDVP